MNDKNTAETSKIVMEELDRVSFFAGTKHEIHGLQLSIFSLSSGKWRDLWELSHGRVAF